MLGYWLYATHKKKFYIFLSKTQASQLIAIKDNKQCAYILKVCKKTEQSRKKKSRIAFRSQTKKLFFFFYLFGLDLAQPYELNWI